MVVREGEREREGGERRKDDTQEVVSQIQTTAAGKNNSTDD